MKHITELLSRTWLPIILIGFAISFDLKYDPIGITFLFLTIQTTTFLIYLFTRSKNINLIIAYNIFSIFFLNIIPWLHYSENIILWRTHPIEPSTYITLNATIFITNLLLFIIYFTNRKKNNNKKSITKEKKVNKKTILVLLTLSSLSFTLLFYLNNFSILQLLFRGVQDEIRLVTIESSSLNLLLGLVSRLIPVFCFLYAATEFKNLRIIKFLLFLLMLASVFPTGVARYLVAFAYIPLMLIYIPRLRSAPLFSATMLISLLFVFPFLNQFRHFSGVENLKFLPTSDFFFAAHFDAYENFASAIEETYISFGWQLLGALLFFVPRAFWPEKPVGSGYQLADQLGYIFNNISMPFLGEGYVNFGFIGVFLFTIALGYLIRHLDQKFSIGKNKFDQVNFSTSIYFYLIGSLFFILRGDLLSSTAYVTAGLFSAFLVSSLCRRI